MEFWDLYDEKRQKLNKTVKRGDKLNDDEYHIVVNVWIKNSKNEFLITQRSKTKSFPLMWECTGGSALEGEDSLDAAIREVEEELGVKLNRNSGELIGTKLRYYSGCPDILDVWVFEADIPIKKVVYQEEEVCNVMWASVEKIKELHLQNKFEANAFFEEALMYTKKEEIYYIGFNANNAICNEKLFNGSITLYPTKEKGNIYFSDKSLPDTKSKEFMEKYKSYIYKTAKKIQSKNPNSKFLCFNEKIRKLCSDMKDINIVKGNEAKTIDFLNNKFKTRDLVKDSVPVLDYFLIDGDKLDYDYIKGKISCDKFIVQAETGAGGNSTYLIDSKNKMDEIEDKTSKYCISKYVNHTPLNVTLIIGEDDVIFLPISVQLIRLTDNKFKYVGGDFISSQTLSKTVIQKLDCYSNNIAEKVKKMGYRGILGIDYILCENGDIIFMEINPRFQASSFLISMYLEKHYNTNVAKLHYLAITNSKIEQVPLIKIDNSFVNCNSEQKFDKFENPKIVNNGYFEPNKSSVYRKVFDYSIFSEGDFEKL